MEQLKLIQKEEFQHITIINQNTYFGLVVEGGVAIECVWGGVNMLEGEGISIKTGW